MARRMMKDRMPQTRLAALETQVKADLHRIAHPSASWLPPRTAASGAHVYDVLIVGAGQCGLATGFGLMRSQVNNILLIDKADEGLEGPWKTYARMPTLRSPKEFTGPDLDIPCLTYQAWHEAMFGEQAWADLDLIPKELWADYLLWYRKVLGLPVRNGLEAVDIAPEDDLLRVTVRGAAGEEALFCRRLVLATGQESTGDWSMPAPLAVLPPDRRAHNADAIDFAALKGRRVAVIGAGASAFDNAATALEHGAAEVHLLCRREEIQVIQPYRWLTFRGFMRHVSEIGDDWRWRFMHKILSLREGFPQHTFDRCARHDAFVLHLGAPLTGARMTGDAVTLSTPRGDVVADFVIAATGIGMDFTARSEMAGFAGNIARWSDRYTPPATTADERLGRFPYLGEDYAFQERVSGQTPWISGIHLFSIASTMSFGPSGSSINAMTTAVPKLVHGITRGLFQADLDHHWASLEAYDVPQAIVRGVRTV